MVLLRISNGPSGTPQKWYFGNLQVVLLITWVGFSTPSVFRQRYQPFKMVSSYTPKLIFLHTKSSVCTPQMVFCVIIPNNLFMYPKWYFSSPKWFLLPAGCEPLENDWI
ncbi:hypothetical protein AVEN_238931-1 [Araneus ventricosus]|uniref:Uncharacterized protein n=1 Tax=Araneus ventricosus TaxID=182803 RepID=A0A4Y2GMX0_ARAVE|nr:hypothetical protein AVEN_238931-1 [Araneus ventricosus]